MRILWGSNAPWCPTGYGTQTAQVVTRLKADGHDVGIAANYGLNGSALNWNGIPVFPGIAGDFGDAVLPYQHRAFANGEPTLLLTLYDVWVYANNRELDDLPIASWVPVDHMPVPPEVSSFARRHPMVAMSRFGQEQLANAGISAQYVPHAIDTGVFRPTPSEARKLLNIPEDAFLVMVNAANKDKTERKSWSEMLTAFWVVASQHDDMFLYLHTSLDDPAGISIRVLLAALGIPESRVRVVPQTEYRVGEFDDASLAKFYTAADVLLSTSKGEGFGIAVIEAQACGTPVIVSDATAQPELVGAGWLAKVEPAWDFTQGAFWAQPLVGSIAEQIRAAYAAKGDATLRDKAVAFAADFDADVVFDRYWRPALRTLEQALLTPPETRQQKRAAARKAKR